MESNYSVLQFYLNAVFGRAEMIALLLTPESLFANLSPRPRWERGVVFLCDYNLLFHHLD